MKTTKSVQVANLVQALFYDGNTPIGQLSDGREVVLSAAQVKLVMRKLTALSTQHSNT